MKSFKNDSHRKWHDYIERISQENMHKLNAIRKDFDERMWKNSYLNKTTKK